MCITCTSHEQHEKIKISIKKEEQEITRSRKKQEPARLKREAEAAVSTLDLSYGEKG
jgi:hypothetical protein